MLPKRHLFGCEKRTKKKREEELKKSQQGAFDKFVLRGGNYDIRKFKINKIILNFKLIRKFTMNN